MLVLLALCFAAPAAANHVQCGDTITQDTTLDSDLTCSGDGLTITGANVTLELNGHTIQGSGGLTAGVGIFDAVDPEVRGGTIRSFRTGVDADGPTGLVVDHMLFEHNGTGVDCTYSPGCSALDSTFVHNSGGIRLFSPDGGSPLRSYVQRNHVHNNGTGILFTEYLVTATDNRIEDNDNLGVEIDYNGRVDMSRNVVAGNGGDGVVVSFLSDATIANNRIEDNGGNGVRVIGDFFFQDTRAAVRDNRIARNGGDGVGVENAHGAHVVIERNQTDRNGDDGIDIQFAANEPPDPNTVDAVVGANRAYFNTDLGIHAVPGTTDGGGNKAKHNGNPAQCVGVSCK